MVNLPLFACLFVCFKLHHRCSHLVSWAFGMLAASPCKTHSYWYHLKFMFDLGQIKAHIESTFQTIYSCNVDFVKCGCFVNHCEWFSCFFFLSLAAIVSLCAHKEEGFSFSPACPHGPPACRWPRCQPCYCIIYCIEMVVNLFLLLTTVTPLSSHNLWTHAKTTVLSFLCRSL